MIVWNNSDLFRCRRTRKRIDAVPIIGTTSSRSGDRAVIATIISVHRSIATMAELPSASGMCFGLRK